MPATTTSGIPYPLNTDKVSDYPAVAKQAAEAVDARLAGTFSGMSAEKSIGVPVGGALATNSVSLTVPGTLVDLTLSGTLRIDGAAAGWITPYVDGVEATAHKVRVYLDRAAYLPGWVVTLPVRVTAGSHTFSWALSVDSASANAIYLNSTIVSATAVR